MRRCLGHRLQEPIDHGTRRRQVGIDHREVEHRLSLEEPLVLQILEWFEVVLPEKLVNGRGIDLRGA